ncbi:MAG: hypothetical protein ACKVOQ_06415 [Cyclobacteriaceae bacterium]
MTLLLFFLAAVSHAQEFKKLRAGFGFGYSMVGPNLNSPKSEGSLLISFEPSYRIKDRISVSIRFEAIGQLFGGGLNVASYGINGQYYFSNKKFRPFAGIGLGFYHPRLSGDTFYGYTSRLEETVLGFYPRAGFDLGQLTIAVEWNIISSSKSIINKPVSNISYDGFVNGNYLSLKIGLSIGGGRKNK